MCCGSGRPARRRSERSQTQTIEPARTWPRAGARRSRAALHVWTKRVRQILPRAAQVISGLKHSVSRPLNQRLAASWRQANQPSWCGRQSGLRLEVCCGWLRAERVAAGIGHASDGNRVTRARSQRRLGANVQLDDQQIRQLRPTERNQAFSAEGKVGCRTKQDRFAEE